MSDCPLCGADSQKAIYMGAPMRLCVNDACYCVWGLGAWLHQWIPIATEDEHGDDAFAFFVYDGAYLPALWAWLRGAGDEK